MKITSISRRPGQRVEIATDGGVPFTLAEEIALREQLRVGDRLGDGRIRELAGLDIAWRAKESALRLLAHRPRTIAELRDRLLRKGFPSELVEDTVAELRERRLLDDGAFARGFVRDRLRMRPQGVHRLTAELRGKGLNAAAAGEAIAEVMQGEAVSEVDLARSAARRWSPRPGEDPLRARRRLYAYLARRGFSSETIAEIMQDADG